jgi:hypothetical protein
MARLLRRFRHLRERGALARLPLPKSRVVHNVRDRSRFRHHFSVSSLELPSEIALGAGGRLWGKDVFSMTCDRVKLTANIDGKMLFEIRTGVHPVIYLTSVENSSVALLFRQSLEQFKDFTLVFSNNCTSKQSQHHNDSSVFLSISSPRSFHQCRSRPVISKTYLPGHCSSPPQSVA